MSIGNSSDLIRNRTRDLPAAAARVEKSLSLAGNATPIFSVFQPFSLVLIPTEPSGLRYRKLFDILSSVVVKALCYKPEGRWFEVR
jgi:hypothetical protein